MLSVACQPVTGKMASNTNVTEVAFPYVMLSSVIVPVKGPVLIVGTRAEAAPWWKGG